MKRLNKIFVVLCSLLVLTACSNILTGKIEATAGAKDDVLNVNTDAQILVRKVEMVQYTKDENGDVKLVLANYPIESFDEYTNPDFPQDLTNEVFYSSVKLNDVELDSEQVKTLVYSNVDKLEPYDKLNEEYIAKYNLIKKDGCYITCSSDWELGDIRVSYQIMNFDKDTEYKTIKETNNN